MPQASQTLHHRQLPLASADQQRLHLQQAGSANFAERLATEGLAPLRADGVDILQVNVGKLCNMTCRHCHVDAGPDRREVMRRETIDECLRALRVGRISTLDLTGGAPEMNPDFRYFVREARSLGVHVIDRCNLTILLARGYEDLVEFLAEHEVEVVASLPCYLESNTDQQRGTGAYQQSIEAIRLLNAHGYGRAASGDAGDDQVSAGRCLTLVYNPLGPSLPPEQMQLEKQYREYLRANYQIEFDRLFTITNMPISRFLEDLLETGQYDEYMQRLVDAFNPAAVEGLMCRHTLSVGWDGQLYDCDFNQMLELNTAGGAPRHIGQFVAEALAGRPIVTGPHCFGCTAGRGSGCQGAIER
jgi:radical SAM/Cys-rich protein